MVAASIMARTGEIVTVYKYGNEPQHYMVGWSIYSYTGEADRLLIAPDQYLNAMAAQDLGLSTSQFRALPADKKRAAIEEVKRKFAPPGGGGSNWNFVAFRDFSITGRYRSILGPIQRSSSGFRAGRGVTFAQAELQRGVVPEWCCNPPSAARRDRISRLATATGFSQDKVVEVCKMIRRERGQTMDWALQELLELKQEGRSNSSAIRRLL